MTVKKRKGRPKMEKVIKKEEIKLPIDQKAEPVKQKDEFVDMFPDREPIYGEDLSANADPTLLIKNGVDWNPREHGYETRLLDADMVDHMGYRGYKPVPKESGIRFKQHPLTDSGIGDKDFGEVATIISKDNETVRKTMLGQALSDFYELRAKDPHVKLNNMVLGLVPIEKATGRRKLACDISNSSMRRDLQEADLEAQKELGNSKFSGKFTLGGNASRSDVDKKNKNIKKVWSVPAQIK